MNIIASVLHLGNVQYGKEESGNAYITTETQIKYLSRVRNQLYCTCCSIPNELTWLYDYTVSVIIFNTPYSVLDKPEYN